MIVSVLLLVCACAQGRVTQSRSTDAQEIEDAWDTLDINLLSIDGNVPNLDNPKRHYAEIYNVINYAAKAQSGCLVPAYSEVYQQYLNVSATRGISDPQGVVNDVKQLIQRIQDEIDQDYDGIVWDAVADAAAELNDLNVDLVSVTNRLAGHQYVISQANDLKNVVHALANVYRVIETPRRVC